MITRCEKLVAICDCDDPDCDDFELRAGSDVVWEFDLGKLARGVGKAFEVPARGGSAEVGGVEQAGTAGATAVPILVTAPKACEELRETAARLVAQLRRPFILLAPTSRYFDAATQGLLAGVGAAFFDLESHVRVLASGALLAPKKAAELFAMYLPGKTADLSESEAARVVGLVMKLKNKPGRMKAPPYDVFVAVVLEGMSQRAAAKRCRCSIGLLAKRVGELESEFKMPLDRLKTFASAVLEMEASVKGDKRRKRRPGSRPGDFADDRGGDGDEGGAPKEEYQHEEGGDDS